ncbi:MAG TPA: DUF1801 domain-containing protein [Niabella sp.]|nr:DUF1801 domain-containing protein [Niabella sp.]
MESVEAFLRPYPEKVQQTVLVLRNLLKQDLPSITEQPDVPAKMIAYTYETRYTDMICCIFPSQKGVKLSFYKGVDLPDPHELLKGTARTTRYLEINDKSLENIKPFLKEAVKMYRQRMGK